MAYATPEQLAQALRIQVIPGKNDELLEQCLDAAAAEIDYDLDRVEPLPDPVPPEVVRTNVNRAVEWYKANDVTFGAGGSVDTGSVTPPPLPNLPADSFTRHSQRIIAHKQQWGVA